MNSNRSKKDVMPCHSINFWEKQVKSIRRKNTLDRNYKSMASSVNLKERSKLNEVGIIFI